MFLSNVFGRGSGRASRYDEDSAKVAAISRAQAVIEFNVDGVIITANENFLTVMGYRLEEIQGRRHSMFAEPRYAESAEYREFWARLGRGTYQAGEFRRYGKGGKEVWIQAAYSPLLDNNGRVFKVVKFATDIAAEKLRNADYAGQIAAIGKSQAVIEFNLDGTIVRANENFLTVMGYRLEEVQGKHHSMFAEPQYASSADYKEFWARLGRGEYQAGEFKRLGRGGKEVWIQASYNPILDSSGRPFKVVKFATDVTADKLRSANYAGQISAIGKSQAVIEFNLDGTITTANENFLSAMGYRLEEIQGKHHKIFAEPDYASSADYQEFWARLNRGEYQAGEYKRLGRGGKEVWIQASYNPILDLNGKPFKIVKFASDVTAQVLARKRSESVRAIDLHSIFWPRDYVRDWPSWGTEGECDSRGLRKSRWFRSCGKRIGSQWSRWPSGTASTRRQSTCGVSGSGAFSLTTFVA